MSGRVMIVDDDPDDVEMLKRFLAKEASVMHGVTDSAQVERAFREFEPDIVLLDLHMPDPDGYEVLRRLRSMRAALGFLPVIVLTGDFGRLARESALILGADDFLTKPLDAREVVLRVRNLLRTRQLYVELAEAEPGPGTQVAKRELGCSADYLPPPGEIGARRAYIVTRALPGAITPRISVAGPPLRSWT